MRLKVRGPWVVAVVAAGTLGFAVGAGGVLGLAPRARGTTLPCLPPLSPCTTTTSTTTTTTKPPPPKPPPPVHAGATYDGHHGNTYSQLVVSRNGARVAAFDFVYSQGVCSDGGKYGSDFPARISKGANIDEQGRASYTHKYSNAYWFTRSGKRVNGQETISFSVRFAGDHVRGTLQDHFTSAKLTCYSGTLSFTSYRDGTPHAPLRTGQIETGKYHGAARNGTTPFSLRIYLPWAIVSSFDVSWKAKCRNGGALSGRYPFYFMKLSNNDVHASGSDQFTLKGGYRGTEHYTLSSHFYRVHGDRTYRLRGSWRYTGRIYKGSKQVTTCPLSVTLAGHP